MNVPISTEQRGRVLEVTIDRPKANAIDAATSRIMGDIFAAFRDNPALNVAIRRYSTPMVMTAGSEEKSRIIASGMIWQTMVKSSMKPPPINAPRRKVSRTRSGFRAPKFWPATGAAANPSATTGMNPA